MKNGSGEKLGHRVPQVFAGDGVRRGGVGGPIGGDRNAGGGKRRRFPRAARAFLGFRVTSGCAVHTVELRAQFSEFTASPSALIMVDDALKMKLILPTLTVLALLMGISGCFDPVRERRDSPDDRTADRYAEGGRNHWVLVSPMLHEPHV